MSSVGFWHALYTLDEGNYTVWEIAKYMTNIWFGLDSSGFDKSRTSITTIRRWTDTDMQHDSIPSSAPSSFSSLPA
jgi:hypothetical protein